LCRRKGPPAALLANPQTQGPVDVFCAGLLTLQTAARIVLMSDALDAGFASRHGVGWLSATATPRQELINRVRVMLAEHNEGLAHGRF